MVGYDQCYFVGVGEREKHNFKALVTLLDHQCSAVLNPIEILAGFYCILL